MLEEQQPIQQPSSTEGVNTQQGTPQGQGIEKAEKTKKNLVKKTPQKTVKTVQQVPVKKKTVQRTEVVRQKKEVPFKKEEKKSDVSLVSSSKETPLAPEMPFQSSSADVSIEVHDSYFAHKVVLLLAIAALLFFNQMQIGTVSALLDVSVPMSTSNGSGNGLASILSLTSSGNFDDVDISTIQSTAQGIAALFPIDEIETTQDAIAVMVPSGTPEYGEAMGVSFDDPVASLAKMRGAYESLKKIAKEDEAVWKRYLNLAAAPRGVTCEFCCGVGAQGITASGELRCGCQHNPSFQSLTLWLMMNTDYSDAEVLYEVYRWKSLWFPKNMVDLALQIAGGDSSVSEDLPGMVGGC